LALAGIEKIKRHEKARAISLAVCFISIPQLAGFELTVRF
jgi:hypothetical protein